MKLLGDAAVAMWWKVAEEHLIEFHEWHSKEHLPERLSIPGFCRGSRWQREGTGEFFVIYELDSYDTLTSDSYRARLDQPTPWSAKMMPLHGEMIRSQCRIVASSGGGVATYMMAIRLSPETGSEIGLEAFIRAAAADLPRQAGVTGAHLLRTETPAAAPTTEQKIRGGDAVADWVFMVSGHSESSLIDVCARHISSQALSENGARKSEFGNPFRLVHAVVAQDVR